METCLSLELLRPKWTLFRMVRNGNYNFTYSSILYSVTNFQLCFQHFKREIHRLWEESSHWLLMSDQRSKNSILSHKISTIVRVWFSWDYLNELWDIELYLKVYMKSLNENIVLFPPPVHIKVACIMFLNAPQVPLFEKKKISQSLTCPSQNAHRKFKMFQWEIAQ